MPNWCENILRLEHPNKSKLAEALQAFNKEKLLDYFVPEPVHDDPEAKNDMPKSYVWRMKNWGTKWDIAEVGYKWISDHCLNFLLTRHGVPQFPPMMLLLPSMASNLWHSTTNPIWVFVANTCRTKKTFALTMMTKFRPILMRCLASRN